MKSLASGLVVLCLIPAAVADAPQDAKPADSAGASADAGAAASAVEAKPADKTIAELRETIEALQKKVAEIEAERDQLRLQLKKLERAERKSQLDQFPVGSIWRGACRLARGAPRSRRARESNQCTLTITDRTGEKFKGTLVLQLETPELLEVSGRLPSDEGGKVAFESDAVGVMAITFNGVLKGGRVSLTFEGTGLRGRRVMGTATLSR